MPYSARENDDDIIAFVTDNNIRTVIDVGAGSGTYGKMLRDKVDCISGVEIWKPYISEFNLTSIYDCIHRVDVRKLSDKYFAQYDMIIFGDVLEHMPREESLEVWRRAHKARYGLISVPIIHYPQGAEFGNPYEEHVQEHMHPEDIRRDYGPFIFDKEYEITGTFIKDFNDDIVQNQS